MAESLPPVTPESLRAFARAENAPEWHSTNFCCRENPCPAYCARCRVSVFEAAATALAEARQARDQLASVLCIYIHAHITGNSVPPHIEANAKAACKFDMKWEQAGLVSPRPTTQGGRDEG